MCARCVQGVCKMFARCLQDVCKMCASYVQDVFKVCSICVQDVRNMCARCVQDVRKMCVWCVQELCKMFLATAEIKMQSASPASTHSTQQVRIVCTQIQMHPWHNTNQNTNDVLVSISLYRDTRDTYNERPWPPSPITFSESPVSTPSPLSRQCLDRIQACKCPNWRWNHAILWQGPIF